MAAYRDYVWKIGNKKQVDRRSNHRELDRFSVTFYVSNFPSFLTARDLWKEFEGYGKLVDVYIARKVSKLGKRFAFIRYANVIEERKLEARLQVMWIGNFHLFVSVARFNRDNTTKTNNLEKQGEKVKDANTVHGKNTRHGVSYVNIVKGSKGASSPSPQQVNPSRKVILGSGDYQKKQDYNRIALGEVNNATVIPQLLRVCYDEGFDEVKISYVGGMWVWIEFMSEMTCSKFKQHQGIGAYFKQIVSPTNSFVVKERAIWIEIQGMPLQAWSLMAYKKVASLYGTIMFSDEELEEHRSSGKVCVCSDIKETINETANVVVDGLEYEIQVREIANWWPDIQKVQDDVGSESEAETDDGVASLDQSEMEEDVDVNEVIADSFNEESVDRNMDEKHVDMEKTVGEVTTHGVNEEDQSKDVKEAENSQKSQPNNVMNQPTNQNANSEESNPTCPPGFNGMKFNSNNDRRSERREELRSSANSASSICKGNSLKSIKRSLSTGSLIVDMEKYVEIGGALGYDLTGCKEDITRLVKRMGEKHGVK
ncbi:hypothetical protein CTI12_AA049920 [Artemisia annua]|uniref:RRM domain-containing protein n=1 Tax=Artemisia annua TaxID=35608 RepID=A0A2U1QBD9_ARTAN|nr:hypothetical protein CTI12_AA049920 [Artemisia annua]